MQKLLNNLNLFIKINLSAFISIIGIITLTVMFYIVTDFFIAMIEKNNESSLKIRSITNDINNNIGLLDHITLNNSITESKMYDEKSKKLYDKLLEDTVYLNNSDFFKNNNKILDLIKKIQVRIKGYKMIADSLRDEIKEDSEDGLYAILALSSARQKIFNELESLNREIADITKQKILYENVKMQKTKNISLVFTLLLFLLIAYTNKIIISSILHKINALKDGIESFFDLLSHKRDDVVHISQEGIDEISEIANIIDSHLHIAEEILNNERREAEIIEAKVKEATSEIQALNDEVEATQREIVFTMGAIAEQRSKETGEHVKRVAEYSLILARLYGLSIEESILLKNASPMHDIGKIGIPDSILNKPAKFTEEEFELMKTHSEIGYEMLKHSNKSILKAAAILAYEHHERWDGKGYPRGIKGEEIHIYGRITAIADVFDALGSDRVYKEAWPLEKILNLFKEERGKQFDPNLIDIFLDNLEHFLASKMNIEQDDMSLSKYIEDFENVEEYI